MAQDDTDLIMYDMREIQRALGVFDGAQPISAHEVVHQQIIPAIRILRAASATTVRPTKECPLCKSQIATGAIVCPQCGRGISTLGMIGRTLGFLGLGLAIILLILVLLAL